MMLGNNSLRFSKRGTQVPVRQAGGGGAGLTGNSPVKRERKREAEADHQYGAVTRQPVDQVEQEGTTVINGNGP